MSIPIKLQVFEGPMDLLLHLIDKNKLDIYDIPIVQITDQYLDYIRGLEANKLEVMSEFIEMAATLINIKSKMLLPAPVKEEEEYVDPRLDLVERLVEYKKYKLIAGQLKGFQDLATKVYFKVATIPDEVKDYVPTIDPKEIIGDLDFSKLFSVFQSVMKKKIDKIDPIRSKFGEIRKEVCTVQDKMDALLLLKKHRRSLYFRELLEEQTTKVEVIVTFLAILEFMKMGFVLIKQENVFDEILIEFTEREEYGNQ